MEEEEEGDTAEGAAGPRGSGPSNTEGEQPRRKELNYQARGIYWLQQCRNILRNAAICWR